jgi:hypothetical protein
MRRISIGLALAVALFMVPLWAAQAAKSEKSAKSAKTDAAISQEIVRSSIASYSGSCPCPYNTDRAGRSCGRRSAYGRPGGASPICYSSDITKKMIDDYRKRTNQ